MIELIKRSKTKSGRKWIYASTNWFANTKASLWRDTAFLPKIVLQSFVGYCFLSCIFLCNCISNNLRFTSCPIKGQDSKHEQAFVLLNNPLGLLINKISRAWPYWTSFNELYIFFISMSCTVKAFRVLFLSIVWKSEQDTCFLMSTPGWLSC